MNEKSKVGLFENRCPKCGQAPILEFFLKSIVACENCGYVFQKDPGAFTGPLYINLSVMGLSTFPFILFLLLTGASVVGVGVLVILEMIFISPFSLHFAKLFCVHMEYRGLIARN